MDVAAVNVCSNHHLIPRQMLLGKLLRQLERQLRGDLSGRKGLNDVVCLPSIGLAHGTLGVHHLLVCKPGITIQVRSENLLLRFISVQHIFDGLL